MAKKKEEKEEIVEEKPQQKKVVKKKKPQAEKEPLLKLIAESGEDTGIVAGALNNKGLYLQFLDDLKNHQISLRLTKKEFDELINEFKYGEL